MIISISLQIFGLLCLSLVMDKHFKAAFARPLTQQLKTTVKVLGWFAIGFSVFFLLLLALPFAITLVKWMGFLSANILLVSLIHSRIALKAKR